MDIADDNLTLPLPSALIKRQLQRGVGFLVDDDGDSDDGEDMDVTQPLGGIIVPPRDGVNRFLNKADEDDQTMEFTQVYRPSKDLTNEDDTAGMEFTKVVGKIQGLRIPGNVDKENRPPVFNDDDGILPQG